MKFNSIKPPYRVPTMKEISEVPWNGFTVASTFSGCGGSSLGYKMAGFKVAWASEFIKAAQQTYRDNHTDTILDTRDIRNVQPDEILSALGMESGQLDLLDGSPPCASFSLSGNREDSWGLVKAYSDTKQRTDDLFFEFVRILKGVQPKVFVAENVKGLISGKAKGYFLEILSALKASGYDVSCRVLDAQWLGVPQGRQRTIFIGVRNDLKAKPAHPLPLPYRYSIRDAIPWVTSIYVDQVTPTHGDEKITKFKVEKTLPTVTANGIGSDCLYDWTVAAESGLSGYCAGREWDKLSIGQQSEKYFNLIKVNPNKPSPTICASHGTMGSASPVHPVEKRKFSIAELKRLCAFPDDFILSGSYAKQWERPGRAVPPVMMSHIAATIRDQILNKCAHK